jgi:hypothetical protein
MENVCMKGNVLIYYKALSQHTSGENEENKIKTYSAPGVSDRNSNPIPHPLLLKIGYVAANDIQPNVNDQSDGVLEKATKIYIMALPRNLSGGNAKR